MTWTKLSDDFSDDCWTLTDAEFRLHVEALIWSNRKLLDCRIPKDDLRRFATHPELASSLIAVGWWTETTTTYVVRHHATYQRTREQVVKRQQTSAVNGAKGGRPAREIVGDNPADNPVGNPSANPQGQDRTGLADNPPRRNVFGVGTCANCSGHERIDDDGLCQRCAEAEGVA